jgi:hypothetical protein
VIVRAAAVGSRFVDCVTPITPASAKALKAAGIDGVMRYLGGFGVPERDAILNAGLELGCVTYSRAPGWTPTPGMGTTDGQAALARLNSAGMPRGMTVWLDLEGCQGTAAEAIAWVTEWSSQIVPAGYIAGLYVGSFQPLNAVQLYSLPVTAYWRSLSEGCPEPACGWQMIQCWPTTTVCGIGVDYDFTMADHKNRFPMILAST